MTRPGLLRISTAAVLLASAVAFLIGSHLERAGHHETAAEHALENGTAPSSPPSTAPATTPTPARSTPAGPTSTASRPTPSPTKDPRLSAPEGSKAREAGERAARHPQPDHAPTHAAPTGSTAAVARTPSPSPTADAPEGSAAREAAERSGATASTRTSASESSERLLGINTESTGLIALSVAATTLLALGLLLLPSVRARRLTAVAAVLFCLAAAALDLREVTHQNALGRTNVVTAAVIVMVLHVLAGILAAALAAARPPGPALVSQV